jgi:hypothetical protein
VSREASRYPRGVTRNLAVAVLLAIGLAALSLANVVVLDALGHALVVVLGS